jgi:glutathione S-transferase
MGEYEFTYFKMYKARGEPPRIALHASGVPWKDTSIDDFAKWGQDKAAGKYATGVPVLRTPNGKEYTQSIAIARFTARLGSSGLYPTDPEAALAVDEIMDVCQDAFSKLPQDKDQDVVKAKREEYAAGKLKAFMDILAKRLDESGGPFLTGPQLTIADLVAKYFVTEPLKKGEFPHIAQEYVEQWPTLLKFDSAVENHAIVTAYQASKSA